MVKLTGDLNHKKFKHYPYSKDLIRQMLAPLPENRISASKAITHSFFKVFENLHKKKKSKFINGLHMFKENIQTAEVSLR